MKKLKIAFIGQKGYPATYGGVEKVVEKLVNKLAERENKCFVYSRKYYSTTPLNLPNSIKLIKVHGIKSKRLDSLSHTLISLVHSLFIDIDIISIHSFGNSVFCPIPKLLKRKVVVHLHGFEWNIDKWNKFDKFLFRIPLLVLKRFTDAITTVSIEQKNELEKFGINSIYISNGIERFTEEIIPFECSKPYILFYGRLVPQKGVELLIQAFNKINHKGFLLFIVGEHNDAKDYYNNLILLSKSNDRIKFLGYKYGDELIEIIKGAYCVVIPSEIEANPMVLLESLAAIKCIIASDIPSIRNIAGDSVCYFENRKVESLQQRLLDIMIDNNLKNIYEELALKFDVYEKYNWDIITSKYEDLYQQVVYNKREK